MHLDLVGRGHDLGLGEQALEVMLLEIGDTDRAGLAVGVDLLHRLPGLDEIADLGQRPMDQIQVDVLDTEPFQGLVGGLEASSKA